jgi:hypothetical protein
VLGKGSVTSVTYIASCPLLFPHSRLNNDAFRTLTLAPTKQTSHSIITLPALSHPQMSNPPHISIVPPTRFPGQWTAVMTCKPLQHFFPTYSVRAPNWPGKRTERPLKTGKNRLGREPLMNSLPSLPMPDMVHPLFLIPHQKPQSSILYRISRDHIRSKK